MGRWRLLLIPTGRPYRNLPEFYDELGLNAGTFEYLFVKMINATWLKTLFKEILKSFFNSTNFSKENMLPEN